MTGVRLLLFVAAVLHVWAQVPTEDPFDDTTDRIIVQFKHSVHDMQTTELETALAELDEHVPLGTGLQMVRHSSAGLVMKVAGGGVSPLELEATIANMTNHPQVASVEIDTRIQSLMVPDDTLYRFQWNLQESSRYRQGMNLPSAWAMAPKLGRGVVVGLIDSGIAPHVDLPNVLPGVCPKEGGHVWTQPHNTFCYAACRDTALSESFVALMACWRYFFLHLSAKSRMGSKEARRAVYEN